MDTTTLVGVSEGYAPIEQYMPGGVSHFCPQTDIYSLAATLYTLLKGNRPLNAFEIRQAGLPSLRASASVVSAIKMAMSNDIEQRPKSVKHFVDLLLSYQGTISLPAATPQLIPVEPKFDEKDCFVKLIFVLRIVFFKVVLRLGKKPKALGFIYPNEGANHRMSHYVMSVDEVEEITGIDFFYNLPDDIEEVVEASANINEW